MNNLPLIKKALTMLVTFGILLAVAGSAMAGEKSAAQGGNVPAAPQKKQGPTDPAELQVFVDGLLGKEMEDYRIAGATISVVKDGKLFFAKGYGYADLERKITVDPEQTGFQIGSVTKLFTWTAVMQLVEQGKLDPDADINTYLDFRIPDTYPKAITLKHLMTHTAGFEDPYFERNALNVADLIPVREWLVSHMPARVRPPGDCAAYSNYGASLAGYIVARVSGQPYDEYIQEHILAPLGMAHTTARMPVPPDLRAAASVGYTYVDGTFQRFPDYFAQSAVGPAGGMQASATDMARFMIAHLQDGSYSDASIAGARILKDATAETMHSTLYTPDPRLLGTAYGLFDFSDNGQRALGHSGGAHPFYSLLLLLPDQKLGVFVSYNGAGGGDLTTQHLGFQRAFFDHYFPAPAIAPRQSPPDFAERANQFEGTFRITAEGTYTTIEKASVLFGKTVQISNPGDGTLALTTPWGEKRLVEVEPLYFRQTDGPFGVVFREDDRGSITHMFIDVTPMYAFEKLNWYETPGFSMALLLACVLMFLSGILVFSIRAMRNRSGARKLATRTSRAADWILAGVCILNLLFVTGTYLWGEPNLTPMFGVTPIYKIVLGLGVVSAGLTAGALVYAVLVWKNGYRGIAGRVHYTVVTFAAVAFVWFLHTWNLLGWRF